MSLRIKREDTVLVISGRYKGARGRVLRVDPKDGKAIVEGVNIIKKHQKPRGQNDPGGIIEREAPIAMSKLMLVEPGAKGRAARFAVKTDDKGRQGARAEDARRKQGNYRLTPASKRGRPELKSANHECEQKRIVLRSDPSEALCRADPPGVEG